MSGDEERAQELDRYLDAVLAGRDGRDDRLLAALRAVPPPSLPEAFTPPPARRRLPLRAAAAVAAALLVVAVVAVPQARAQAAELVQLVLGGVRYVRGVVAGDGAADVETVRERALAAVRRPGQVFYLEGDLSREPGGPPEQTWQSWYDADGGRARFEIYGPGGRLEQAAVYRGSLAYYYDSFSGRVRQTQAEPLPGYPDAPLRALGHLLPLLSFPEQEVIGQAQLQGRRVLHVRSRFVFGPDAYDVEPGLVRVVDLYLDIGTYLPVRMDERVIPPGGGPDDALPNYSLTFSAARFVDPGTLPSDHFSPDSLAAVGTLVRHVLEPQTVRATLAQAAALPYRTYWLGPAYPVAWQDRAGRQHDRMEPADVRLPDPGREGPNVPGILEVVGTTVSYGVDAQNLLVQIIQLPAEEFDANVAVRRGDQPWEHADARIEERDPAGREGFIYSAPTPRTRGYGMALRLGGTAVHVYVVPHTDADGTDNRNPLNSVEALRAMAAALEPIPPQP